MVGRLEGFVGVDPRGGLMVLRGFDRHMGYQQGGALGFPRVPAWWCRQRSQHSTWLPSRCHLARILPLFLHPPQFAGVQVLLQLQ